MCNNENNIKNVKDIKREKQLNLILPKTQVLLTGDRTGKNCAFFVHLYYQETLDVYAPYLENIPEEIPIYFTYSNEEVKMKIEKMLIARRNNYFFVPKENRGRDISALLVAFRPLLCQYQYICFLHDKRERSPELKTENELWIYSLWENMAGSKEYILNILQRFEQEPTLGVLAPPALVSEKSAHGYRNQWGNNFEQTISFMEQLGITCNLKEDKTPITLGTVFWARTKALEKLFSYPFVYEDFDPEPLAIDQTISHVIERCFAYVAQGAGYDTGWVMTDTYASTYIDVMQSALYEAFDALKEGFGIASIFELNRFQIERKKLNTFVSKREKIYIYGAGKYGISCFKYLHSMGVEPKGFLVTQIDPSQEVVFGCPVMEVNAASISKDDGIIIAVSEPFVDQVLNTLDHAVHVQAKRYLFKQQYTTI